MQDCVFRSSLQNILSSFSVSCIHINYTWYLSVSTKTLTTLTTAQKFFLLLLHRKLLTCEIHNVNYSAESMFFCHQKMNVWYANHCNILYCALSMHEYIVCYLPLFTVMHSAFYGCICRLPSLYRKIYKYTYTYIYINYTY